MAFTLDDLRTGHIVEFRNGDFYFVIKGDSIFDSSLVGFALAGKSSWTAFGGTQKDFHSNIDNSLDIINVYSIENIEAHYTSIERFGIMKEILFCKTKAGLEKILKNKCVILYQSPAKKLTVSEISELLGYRVEIVEG